MNTMTTQEAAERWGCSRQRVLQLLIQDRVRGAIRFGKAWAIPVTAKRPKLLKPGRKS